MVKDINSYTRITTIATAGAVTQVVTGQAILERIIVGATTAVIVGVIDNTSGTTVNVNKIGSRTNGAIANTYWYGVQVGTGIRIITTGATTVAPDITVVWRQ